ncbi:DUF418 domain-containing protein [Amycolatopsis sp. NBC_00345]|uniref:DUF418 domain-containing protein n=1 Tax=Amycolatopsis sp. NBC_00345 TaxID=2975955 RepID=UPI003FA47000
MAEPRGQALGGGQRRPHRGRRLRELHSPLDAIRKSHDAPLSSSNRRVATLWQLIGCVNRLRRYRQGPLEWLWRWATWAHRPPLRRAAPSVEDVPLGGPTRSRG